MGHNISCMYKVASHTYKVGDKVLFDYRNDSFVNKKSIWSAIIVKITATNNIKIQFDGVVYPYDTPELGPQHSEFMEIWSLRPATILPRESKPDDDMKTLAWKKHINDNLELNRQKMLKYEIGQTISYKEWNYKTETQEIHNGIITSTNYVTNYIFVLNRDGEIVSVLMDQVHVE